MGECTWENRETYESVSLEIGNPGTAPDAAAVDLARKIAPKVPS